MLRTALFIAALAAATGNASAHGGGYIRSEVIRSEPSVSVTVGSVRHDGFRVEYESGGRIYNTIRERYPDRYIPAPVVVVPVAVPRPYYRDDDWRDDRRHWRGEHRDWRDDRRHWRGKHHRHGGGHRYDD